MSQPTSLQFLTALLEQHTKPSGAFSDFKRAVRHFVHSFNFVDWPTTPGSSFPDRLYWENGVFEVGFFFPEDPENPYGGLSHVLVELVGGSAPFEFIGPKLIDRFELDPEPFSLGQPAFDPKIKFVAEKSGHRPISPPTGGRFKWGKAEVYRYMSYAEMSNHLQDMGLSVKEQLPHRWLFFMANDKTTVSQELLEHMCDYFFC